MIKTARDEYWKKKSEEKNQDRKKIRGEKSEEKAEEKNQKKKQLCMKLVFGAAWATLHKPQSKGGLEEMFIKQ